MSEEEWKPKNRPQSLMAQNFSLALDNVFGLDGSFERSQAIQDKKFNVDKESEELKNLEARLKATEERLRSKGVETPKREEKKELKEIKEEKKAPVKAPAKKAVEEDSDDEESDTPEEDEEEEESDSDESSSEDEK